MKRPSARVELIAFKRRIKALIVEAAMRGWLTSTQAKFALKRLGLKHE